jgi:hypothetical protein
MITKQSGTIKNAKITNAKGSDNKNGICLLNGNTEHTLQKVRRLNAKNL